MLPPSVTHRSLTSDTHPHCPRVALPRQSPPPPALPRCPFFRRDTPSFNNTSSFDDAPSFHSFSPLRTLATALPWEAGTRHNVDAGWDSAAETAVENSGGTAQAQAKQSVLYERISNRWEVGFVVSDGVFQHFLFANSISTARPRWQGDYDCCPLNLAQSPHFRKSLCSVWDSREGHLCYCWMCYGLVLC